MGDMGNMQDTINQYMDSCRQARKGIDDLNEQIIQAQKEGTGLQGLQERRYLLYSELADMQAAITAMKEYLDTGAAREAG